MFRKRFWSVYISLVIFIITQSWLSCIGAIFKDDFIQAKEFNAKAFELIKEYTGGEYSADDSYDWVEQVTAMYGNVCYLTESLSVIKVDGVMNDADYSEPMQEAGLLIDELKNAQFKELWLNLHHNNVKQDLQFVSEELSKGKSGDFTIILNAEDNIYSNMELMATQLHFIHLLRSISFSVFGMSLLVNKIISDYYKIEALKRGKDNGPEGN